MSINEFVVITPDTCAMVADQLHPETGGSASDSVDRIARYFDGMAVGGFYFNTISVELGMVQASGTVSFLLVAQGDTVTVGSTVFTGTNGTPGATQFQTNATPSLAADIVAAASLAAAIKANAATNVLVSVTYVTGTPKVLVTVIQPGLIGNYMPLAISAHGSIISPVNPLAPVSPLGTAATYAVLAKSAVSSSGNTVLIGDLGISPGTSITGFPPGLYSGNLHQTDAAAAQAQLDVTSAAAALKATSVDTDITSTDLGSYSAVPGHYKANVAGTWTAGALTLNGAGRYIFEFGTSLTLPANASIILTNGATADNVYFITGTTFIFGATNTTYGNILAGTAITTASATNHTGRLLIYGASGTAVSMPSAATINSPVGGQVGGGANGGCLPRVVLA